MRQITVCFALLALAVLPAAAAEEKILDLASGGYTGVVDESTELTFKIVNRLPAARYKVTVATSGLLAPFDADLFKAEAAKDDRAAGISEVCTRVLKRLTEAGSGDSESALRGALVAAKANSPDKDCMDRIKLFEAGTQGDLGEKVTLAQAQTVTITVTRSDPGRKRWEFVFSTGEDRGWLVHYGFSFLPDEDEEFFTRKAESVAGQPDKFLIVQSADRGGAEFEPTVNFTYLPRFSGRKAWKPLFTAGLGADLDERLVFAGLSWVIGDNVSLFVGAAGHQQTRLKGQYEIGQELGQELAADQLVDDTYDVNAIFGVGLRFNSSPFKKKAAGGDTAEKDDAKKDAKQDKAKKDGKKDDGKKDGAKEDAKKDDSKKDDPGANPSTTGEPGSESPVTDPPSMDEIRAFSPCVAASGDGASGVTRLGDRASGSAHVGDGALGLVAAGDGASGVPGDGVSGVAVPCDGASVIAAPGDGASGILVAGGGVSGSSRPAGGETSR